jgi:murein DD-endopeptidase MepM/ murein hydrolase activator NlpD
MQAGDSRTVMLAITAYAAITGIALTDAFYDAWQPFRARAPMPNVSFAREVPARHVEVTPGLVIPVQGVGPRELTRQFDEQRSGGRLHRAIDIRAQRGTPVLAADDGPIARLATNRLGGLTIYQFDSAKGRVYYYAHLQGYARGLEEGSAVRRGQVIGYVGSSGNAPEHAPHLHFAVSTLAEGEDWWEGTPLDPYDLLTTRRLAAREAE